MTEQNNALNFSENDFRLISEQPQYMLATYQDLITNLQPKSILDVGCGNGYFSSVFLKNNIAVDGIDGSQDALDECKKSGFQNCFFTRNIDEDNLSQITNQYDLIICKDFLEHLLYPENLVVNLKDKLKPGGRLLVHVPNHFPLFFRIKFLFTGKIDTQNFFPGWKEWNNPHIRFFTHEGIQELLVQSGYTIEKDYSSAFFYFTPYLTSTLAKLGISKLLMKISPNLFSAGFTILARR